MRNEPIICQHCHSKFNLNSEKYNWRDKDSINCEVCNMELISWDGSTVYTSTLIERGDKLSEQTVSAP